MSDTPEQRPYTYVTDEAATLTEADLRAAIEKLRNAPMKPTRLPDVPPQDWPNLQRWLEGGKWFDE